MLRKCGLPGIHILTLLRKMPKPTFLCGGTPTFYLYGRK
jgi:hypothetical protein